MRRVIVFTHGGGRLGNQLINFGHLLAVFEDWNREFNVVNMAFWPFADYFEWSARNPLCAVAEGSWRTLPFMTHLRNTFGDEASIHSENLAKHKLHKWAKRIPYCQSIDLGVLVNGFHDLLGPLLLKQIGGARFTALSGWPLRQWDSFKRHEEMIRRFFRPVSSFRQKGEGFVKELRLTHKTIIGVYIRQGDYRQNGYMHYHPPDCYAKWMRQFLARYRCESPMFLIFSDEHVDLSVFDRMPVKAGTGNGGGSGHFMENLVELSECDWIISSPSTFAAWASFTGKVPLLPIASRESDLSEAVPISGCLDEMRMHPAFGSAVV